MPDKASDKVTVAQMAADAAPMPRRSFLLGAGTAVAAGLGPPMRRPRRRLKLRQRPARQRPNPSRS